MEWIDAAWRPYVQNLAVLAFALAIGWGTNVLLRRLARQAARFLPLGLMNHLLKRTERATCALLILIVLTAALPGIALHEESWREGVHRLLLALIVLAFGWMLAETARGVGDWSREYYQWSGKEDNLDARRITTQIQVMLRIAMFLIVLITVIGVAMTIPSLRNVGLSLFASAGVASLALGMAARPALANIVSGMQLAMTQPIRIDDVIVVEGQWGRVEEIGSSFVVVRLWDARRMIVPLTYFMEKPFENWTHTATNLVGSVMLYVDYTLPVEPMRQALRDALESTPLWDKQTMVLQVTDAKERTLELRALMSARNSADLWDLRCLVREKLTTFLRENHPESLPRLRMELPGLDLPPSAGQWPEARKSSVPA